MAKQDFYKVESSPNVKARRLRSTFIKISCLAENCLTKRKVELQKYDRMLMLDFLCVGSNGLVVVSASSSFLYLLVSHFLLQMKMLLVFHRYLLDRRFYLLKKLFSTTEKEQHQLLYLGFSIHQEVASDSFCFLINSSWLLVFILFLFLHALGLNLYWWKGIHFS